MKILFITRHFYPRVGGVEKQVFELSRKLAEKGHEVKILTERYNNGLKQRESAQAVEVIRISYPKTRILGLLYIWLQIFSNSWLILSADVVHTHGVYIWYWPFRLLFFWKKAFTTFHGWEGIYPIPLKNKIIRKIDSFLSDGNITIHDYVKKWYGIEADIISYTAVDVSKNSTSTKDYKSLVYVGRLDGDTGLPIILDAVKGLKGYKIDFCGDGPLKKVCGKYGTVHGFTDPSRFLAKAFICLSPGVTTILEAFSYKTLVVTAYNNPLKKDYLLMTPFRNWIIVEGSSNKLKKQIEYYSQNPSKAQNKVNRANEWVKTQNWENEVNRYYKLWKV